MERTRSEISCDLNKLDEININDILEVACDGNNEIQQARVLQIKDDELNEKSFYVHFLNLEKRMDRWVSSKMIKSNMGQKSFLINGNSNSISVDRNVLTRKRSSMLNNHDNHTEGEPIENTIKIKNIEKIILGFYEIETWYYSPYPNEFTTNKILFICEFCLKYFRKKSTLIKHMKKCRKTDPPGIEIYNHNFSNSDSNKDRVVNSISVYEIIAEENKIYCQNLCLIAKLFLDHKSIYFDVSPFKFYILTENDNNGKHIVAYFSKEISQETEFNLACIMVLPPYQRKGYGQFLISLSYYFSKLEGRICTPETPLSDLGRISYKSYWTNTILEVLLKNKGFLSIKELCEQTGIRTEDIIFTLNELSLIKYWKGQQVIQSINVKQIEEFLNKKNYGKKHYLKFNSKFMKKL